MKVKLTQKEIEYLLYLINESIAKESETDNGMFSAREYTQEDLELIDKLETALKVLEIKRFGLGEASKTKYLN